MQEDLENSLVRASQQQGRLNPALKGDIQVRLLIFTYRCVLASRIMTENFHLISQVAVLEDIIQGMKVRILNKKFTCYIVEFLIQQMMSGNYAELLCRPLTRFSFLYIYIFANQEIAKAR